MSICSITRSTSYTACSSFTKWMDRNFPSVLLNCGLLNSKNLQCRKKARSSITKSSFKNARNVCISHTLRFFSFFSPARKSTLNFSHPSFFHQSSSVTYLSLSSIQNAPSHPYTNSGNRLGRILKLALFCKCS